MNPILWSGSGDQKILKRRRCKEKETIMLTRLLIKNAMANDASDYLWYMTRIKDSHVDNVAATVPNAAFVPTATVPNVASVPAATAVNGSPIAPTPMTIPPMPSASYAKPFPDISKIEVFDGRNFKRWQERIFSILDVHGVAFALIDSKPDDVKMLEPWMHANKVCRHTIISTLSNELFDATLRVTNSGHVLHAYVNGKYIGSQWANYSSQKYVFEHEVKLNPGKNLISLLSAAVGLHNYGPMFDLNVTGVLSPVELVAHKEGGKVVKDLSSQKWSYKVGLDGVANKLYETDCPSKLKWGSDSIPVDRNLTWYKTTFKAPLGKAPVVVDLLGLGKGHAWVNTHSLGRYWPSYIADQHACKAEACDYRGPYSDKKCVSKCGEPTQRW
ncbi:Beta-galactosidase 7-like protein [Theobroma cacao]|uniref:Beta-galactosidase 7-like protein n=1 Tax=Theobroma cacao TaxID=3641 RepID=A0A061GL24_THECC|nr:Beta-galactosidase 7-like protein [Theobroma cacao]